jgi:hypothetical protein
MKLILESTDTSALLAKSALLQARGIPTHLDEVAHVGVVPQHLYIVLDEQFDDALALLADEDHMVTGPVYPDELDALGPELDEQRRLGANWFMGGLATTAIGLMLLLYLLAWLF